LPPTTPSAKKSNEQLVHATPLHTRMGGQVGVLADDVVAIERDEEGLVRVDFDFFFISAIGGQHNTATVCVCGGV
jgi:hypothetical protein